MRDGGSVVGLETVGLEFLLESCKATQHDTSCEVFVGV